MPNRILVVDDKPDLEVLITQRFRKRIRAEQLSFLFASNGEEALTKLQADGPVYVVLADINGAGDKRAGLSESGQRET